MCSVDPTPAPIADPPVTKLAPTTKLSTTTTTATSSGSRTAWLLGILTGLWLCLVAGGLLLLMAYASREGLRGAVPQQWPREADFDLADSRGTLLVFVHPHCPCSRATIDELAWVLTRCGERLDCHVLLVQPAGTADDWIEGKLASAAAAIDGVVVEADPQGRMATLFGARTSGHVMLYDKAGQLLFEGGITPSRGHRGSNIGRQRLVTLSHASANDRSSPSAQPTCVFGCPLLAPQPTLAGGRRGEKLGS
jgi:hypothetical protein